MKLEVKISHKKVDYNKAVQLLEKRVNEVIEGKKPELLWILEHNSIYTGGTSYKKEDILNKNILVVKTSRGGKITYHGPGQKIIYFVLNLNKRKRDIRLLITKIEDCILTNELKETFKQFLNQKELPNLLLSGTAGTGNTTVARALCEELGADYIIINGSDEGRQIDTLRHKIKNFASTVSLTETAGHKVVIVDEADYMNADSVQPALRNFIETFYKNCRFIFTCNFKNKIIPALHSRCTVIDFRIANGQKVKTATSFLDRLCDILK